MRVSGTEISKKRLFSIRPMRPAGETTINRHWSDFVHDRWPEFFNGYSGVDHLKPANGMFYDDEEAWLRTEAGETGK